MNLSGTSITKSYRGMILECTIPVAMSLSLVSVQLTTPVVARYDTYSAMGNRDRCCLFGVDKNLKIFCCVFEMILVLSVSS